MPCSNGIDGEGGGAFFVRFLWLLHQTADALPYVRGKLKVYAPFYYVSND